LVRCLIDQEILTGGEDSIASVSGEPADQSSPPPLSVTGLDPFAGSPTDRRTRGIELLLVCWVAFGGSLLASGTSLFGGAPDRPVVSDLGWAAFVLQEGSALLLLWYVLGRRGKTIRDLGWSWAWKDVGWSVLLHLVTGAAYYFVYATIYSFRAVVSNPSASTDLVGHQLFSGGSSFALLLALVVNPFFEELIVRAYVMTEVQLFTRSAVWAIIVSTLLQTGYHLYQGIPLAVAEGAGFLIFSIYYARTNRIAPIILAHLYADLTAGLYYSLRS
jgi:membrane protease YdiL (CAAX protease family)